MKKLLLARSFVILCSLVSAQDPTVKDLKTESEKSIKKEADTASNYSRKGGIFSLNLTQGSLSNWAAGGDDYSLSLNSYLNLYSFYKKGKNSS